jgi:hypothetical protein
VIALDKVMEFIFIFVVKLNQALAREMEFHADLVAVSVTGSDAIVHLLYKCYWAEACLQRTVSDLAAAKDHGIFSRDVFLHQQRAGSYLRAKAKDATLGEPPPLCLDRPTDTYQLFERERDRDKVAEMWADHPSNFDREINAKARYIRSNVDETPAWSLFGETQELRRLVSLQFYRQVFNVKERDVNWSSGKKVQEFLDDEYAETEFDEERYGIRYIDQAQLAREVRQAVSRRRTPAESPPLQEPGQHSGAARSHRRRGGKEMAGYSSRRLSGERSVDAYRHAICFFLNRQGGAA